MNYPLLLAYTLSIVLLIATPGPVVALVLNTAASAGRRQDFCTILGTNGASLLLIGLSSLVISGLLLVRDGWLAGLSLLGSLVLLWYAATALRSAWGSAATVDTSHAAPPPRAQSGSAAAIVQGLLVGLSNPKDIVFFVAFFPQFIAITAQPSTSLAVLTALWVAADFLILLGYATLLCTAFFQRHRHWVARLSALFLLAVAVGGLGYAVHGLLFTPSP